MTRIRLGIHDPVPGGSKPARGVVVFQPSRRLTDDRPNVVLPRSFAVTLDGVDDDVIVDLTPTAADWCWMATERFGGYTHRRWLIVPESVQVLAYATLSEVDWKPSQKPNPPIAHSIRAVNRELREGDQVDFADVLPRDNINAGDLIVDAVGRVWLVGSITESTLTVGASTGVQLGAQGVPGRDGLSFRSGNGNPNTQQVTGIVGDTYMDVDTGDVYKLA